MTMRCVVVPVVVVSDMIVFVVATMSRMCLVVVCMVMLVVMRVPLLAPTGRKEQCCRKTSQRFDIYIHISLIFTITNQPQRYKNIFATKLQRCF